MSFSRRSLASLCPAALAGAVLLGACGQGAMPEEYRPPVATIHGRLQITEAPADPEEIRVAVVWRADLGLQQVRHLVAQDVAVTTSWPAEFTLDLVDPPPPEAIRPQVGGARMGGANIVAYRDGNHNGRLDFTPIDSDSFVDELIATNSTVALIYSEQPGQPTLSLSTSEGSNLDLATTSIVLNAIPSARSSCHLLEWLPRFAFDEFTPAPKPSDPWPFDEPLNCPNDVPPIEARKVACVPPSPDAMYMSSWTAEPSTFVKNACGAVMRMCARRRDTSLPPPPGWPCPCDPNRFECVDTGHL